VTWIPGQPLPLYDPSNPALNAANGYTYNPGDPTASGFQIGNMIFPGAPPMLQPAAAGGASLASQPAQVAPHLQFSPTAIGTVTMLSFGRARLPGIIIWAEGITATNVVADTSTLTFATAYCEPINAVYDVVNGMKPLRMWANGTLFYDVNQGGAFNVASITPAQQDSMRVSVASMAVYLGGESQVADPVMESILGVGNVPAYRGLRYIRFTDFPLAIAGNSVPNINVEWGFNPDPGEVAVSTIMGYLVARVYSRQMAKIAQGALVEPIQVFGVTNQAYGLTITDQSALIDHFTKHKLVFSYQIVDGFPFTIVRRPVDGSLTIDLDITEQADCIRRNGAPAITFSRVDPTTLPVAVNLNYVDVGKDFDTKMQSATHDGTGRASSTLAVSTDYCGLPDENRILAFDILYQVRAKALTVSFEIGNLAPQISDVIQLTTDEGNIYVTLVDQQTYTKNRSNQIGALALLTSAGANIAGADGLDTPGRTLLPWVVNWDVIVVGGRIWGELNYVIEYNSWPSPARLIPSSKHYDLHAADLGGSNWGDSSTGNPGYIFEDNTYIYWLSNSAMVISRVQKSAASIGTVETITIAAGFDPNHTNAGITDCAQFLNGKLYVAWSGLWAGAVKYKLVVVDLVAWSPTAFSVYDWWTDVGGAADGPFPTSLVITDNGTILIAARPGSSPVERFFYSNISAPGTWAHIDSTIKLGSGTYSGNIAYFAESLNGSGGVSERKSRIVVVDCTGAPSPTTIDLAVQDANVVNIAQGGPFGAVKPWCSATHLFVACNYTLNNTTDQNEHPYLGRFDLGTLTAAGGSFLSNFIYAERELRIVRGNYCAGQNFLTTKNANGGAFLYYRLVVINEDLSAASAAIYPIPGVVPPVNDNFAAALSIVVGNTQGGNQFYASTETGEPVPSWAASGTYPWVNNNGHSVWFSFVAPATTTYTISSADRSGHGSKSIQVYTGTAVGSLTPVVASAPAGVSNPPTTASLSATAGTTYMISIRDDQLSLETDGTEVNGTYDIEIT